MQRIFKVTEWYLSHYPNFIIITVYGYVDLAQKNGDSFRTDVNIEYQGKVCDGLDKDEIDKELTCWNRGMHSRYQRKEWDTWLMCNYIIMNGNMTAGCQNADSLNKELMLRCMPTRTHVCINTEIISQKGQTEMGERTNRVKEEQGPIPRETWATDEWWKHETKTKIKSVGGKYTPTGYKKTD